MSRIDELTRNDFFKDTEYKVKRRASKLDRPKYLGITKDYTVHMSVKSSNSDENYIVKIKLTEYPDLVDDNSLTTQEKVRLSLAGDIAINCSCPAYRYWGYEYIMTQLSSNAGKDQERYPIIRNPKLEGVMCKHCYRAFRIFGKYWKSIAKDIDFRKFLKGDS